MVKYLEEDDYEDPDNSGDSDDDSGDGSDDESI